MTPWHVLTPEAVSLELQSDLTHGLSAAEAQRRLRVSGLNVLPEAERPSALALFLRQFTSIEALSLVQLGVSQTNRYYEKMLRQVWGKSQNCQNKSNASPRQVGTCPRLA